MKAIKLTAIQVEKVINTIESKIKTANELANSHSNTANGYAHGFGYLEASLLYIIKQLEGVYPI